MRDKKFVALIVELCFFEPLSRAAIFLVQWIVTRWAFVLAAILTSIIILYLGYLLFVSHSGFWDFEGYIAAIKAMELGKSPYDVPFIHSRFGGGTVYFIYPPLVAEAFYMISGIALTPFGKSFLLGLTIASTLVIPYLLAGNPGTRHSTGYLAVCGFYFVLYGLGGVRLVASGNVQAILCGIIVIALVVAVRFKKYQLFWIALAFCAFFKFYFLMFLLFPLILDKKYVSSIVFVLLFAAIYSTNYFYNPDYFQQYLGVVRSASLDTQNAGFSFYSLCLMGLRVVTANDFRVTVLALGTHFIFVLFIVGLSYGVAAKLPRPQSFDLFSCWLLMSAYFVSPRFIEYDMAVLVVPLVRLGHLLLLSRGPGLVASAIVGVSGLILIRTPFVPWVGTLVFLGVWLGAAVHWLAVNGSKTPTATAQLNLRQNS